MMDGCQHAKARLDRFSARFAGRRETEHMEGFRLGLYPPSQGLETERRDDSPEALQFLQLRGRLGLRRR